MPHILLEPHNDISLDENNSLESRFNFVAKSQYDQKISVNIGEKEFLLTKVEKKGNHLIKLDNPTRMTPVSLMKTALNDYAKASKAKILFSNTDSIHKNKVPPQEKYLKTIDYFVNEFDTDKEIYVEVGFGSGTHLIHQAKANPDKIIIGLEIHTPSIEQVLKQTLLQNIDNILVINYDARLFLEFLKSNSVGKIFVHFPVPWDKKPHRRVMSNQFIEESLRVLKIGGTLELRTDSPKYFEYSSGLLDNFKEYPNQIRTNEDLDVVSKYEARWKRQEKTIWDVTITSTETSPEVVLEGTFDFPENLNIEKIKNDLPTKAVIKEDYLVHFETIYTIDENSFLIKLTLGSFNKPITKYILIQKGKARYFQGAPIKTRSNLDSHKLILEYLV